MKTPKPASKLSSSTEYALIFGAGASAAMSLAAQQVAAASVPVTALVAIGLLNRRRLDHQIQAGQPLAPIPEAKSAREEAPSDLNVTARPAPPQATAIPAMQTHPMMSHPVSHPVAPAMSPRPQLRFSSQQQRLMAARQTLLTAQAESLQKIGTQLQQARVALGWSLQDIHQETYIQRYALQAIEKGDLCALPEPFYIHAFIKKYAIALGLPGPEIASQFPIA
ncbi:MAG: helix-turn-helix domain-containing protein [Cyanobacteria bacterium P01_F01_bin.56]